MSTLPETRNGGNTSDSVVGLLGGAAVVGVVLTHLVVYTLPEAIRRSLAFQYSDPTIGTAYTAHFVHFSPAHLAGNLAAFLVVGGTLVALSVKARDRWLLVGVGVTLVFAVPAALSFSNLAIPRNGVMYGFSGVNMTLAGVLPVAIVRYITSRLRRPIDSTALPAVFFLSAGYVGGVAVPPSPASVVVAAVAGGLGVIFAALFSRAERGSSRAGGGRGLVATLVAGIGVWMALLSVGFPEPTGADGAVVNVYVHFFGYALGFTTAYLAHEWGLLGDPLRSSDKNRPGIEPDAHRRR